MDISKFYSDASFSPQYNIGVIGWKIDNHQINTKIIENADDNVTCELYGLIKILEYIIESSARKTDCHIYIDCQSIIDKISKRNTIIDNNFMTKKGKYISNHKLYGYVFDIYNKILENGINLYLHHIVGHKPTHEKDDTDVSFSQVDKLVRRELRQILKCY